MRHSNKMRIRTSPFALVLLLAISYCKSSHSFTLKTSSVVKGSPEKLYNFIATPENWPSIVASSHSVKKSSIRDNPVDVPFQVGDCVEEVFGLPPLLPLSVVWECVVADPIGGDLEFYSKDGVPNFAKNCSMKFSISGDPSSNSEKRGGADERTNVELEMGYEALNPLVFAATPLLNVDNSLALKVLLPLAMMKQS